MLTEIKKKQILIIKSKNKLGRKVLQSIEAAKHKLSRVFKYTTEIWFTGIWTDGPSNGRFIKGKKYRRGMFKEF